MEKQRKMVQRRYRIESKHGGSSTPFSSGAMETRYETSLSVSSSPTEL